MMMKRSSKKTVDFLGVAIVVRISQVLPMHLNIVALVHVRGCTFLGPKRFSSRVEASRTSHMIILYEYVFISGC